MWKLKLMPMIYLETFLLCRRIKNLIFGEWKKQFMSETLISRIKYLEICKLNPDASGIGAHRDK